MSKFAPISLDRVDENDPTLAADGLSEFLPAGGSDSDQMLAVGTLGDLFPVKETDEIADFFNAFSAGSPASMSGEPAEEHEPEKAPLEDDEADEAFVPGQAFRLEGFFESDDITGPSDIQRAAIEFQRFAEKFHEFAIENRQR